MKNFIKNKIKKIYYKFNYKKLLKYHPDWSNILSEYNFNLNSYSSNDNILIATSTGGHRLALSSEILIGLSLKARGVLVDFLLCDENLNACSECTYKDFKNNKNFIQYGSSHKCPTCWISGQKSLKEAGFKTLKFSDFEKSKNLKEVNKIYNSVKPKDIRNFKIDNVYIGEHAYAGTLRYYAKGFIDFTNDEILTLKKFFFAALKTYFISKNLFKKKKYKSVLLNHGIYVPQGIISETAKENKVNVVTWFTAYKKKSFLFSHNETYHKSLLKEDTSEWENIIMDKEKDDKLKKYINSRKYGTDDWVYFHNKQPNFNFKLTDYNKELSNDENFTSLFTNVIWDAQLFFDQNIFKNMVEWVLQTIDYYIKLNKILVIRAHPAEVTGTLPSRQNIFSEIKNKYKKLPKNIIFIHSDDPISSYAIIEKSKFCIVYGSTIATEIASIGKNVLIGGESWIKNKNISYDPTSKAQYFKFIDQLLINSEMNDYTFIRAKKYAYHFFFRRMIPINLIEVRDAKYEDFIINKSSISKIFPKGNSDKGINTICEGILNNKSFTYDA